MCTFRFVLRLCPIVQLFEGPVSSCVFLSAKLEEKLRLIVFPPCRMKHEKESSSSILVQHLSFADMLMGIYLLIIVGADEYYRSV